MMNNYHESVLLSETIDSLTIQQDAWYVDGTLGGGGHTRAILEKGGNVLAIDQDQDALDYVSGNFQFPISHFQKNGKIRLVQGNFVELEKIVKEAGLGNVAGVLFDFGVSSHQFDTPERGFSFQTGPLDMRMDQRLSVTAKDLINGLTRDELTKLFEKYGEERFARAIAAKVVESRVKRNIETTDELVKIITSVVHIQKGMAHPATRVFQALRIAVNDELHSIEEVLPQALRIIKTSGRIVAITFHSLEDRIVKNSFLTFQEEKKGTVLTKKPITPSEEELQRNPRSRSAKLRVFQKNDLFCHPEQNRGSL